MRIPAAIILCILAFILIVPAVSQRAAQIGSASPTPPATTAQRADDVEGLRSDLQRMKSLVQQMETNLAFVSDTQSPLKHQFELEIQMWKVVIAQMERRLDGMKPR